MCCWYFEESSSAFKNIKYQKHYEFILLFHASAHDRNAKWYFFTLLHTAERPKRIFSCFCTLQKGQKEDFRAWRKSFPEWFSISALGESHFSKGLAFPRLAKVISRKVWHFRARRKSFPERFGISALGESRFRDNLLKIVTIKIHKCKR